MTHNRPNASRRDRFRVYDDAGCVLETADVEKVQALLSRMRNDDVPRALVQFVVAGAPLVTQGCEEVHHG